MADDTEKASDDAGTIVAKHTFIWTVIGAVLFVAAIFIFIL